MVQNAPQEPSDAGLIARLMAGDEAAFASLIDRYHGRLLRLAMAFVSDREAAEEVVQETWLGVMNGLASFEGRSSLKTWIFRILTNRAKTRGVRDSRTVAFSELASQEAEPAVEPERFAPNGMWSHPPEAWSADTPETLLLRREARAFIDKTIADLPATYRAVVTLRDVEGLSSEEVCNILQVTETNQRVLLHRARAKLRAALERYLSAR